MATTQKTQWAVRTTTENGNEWVRAISDTREAAAAELETFTALRAELIERTVIVGDWRPAK